MDGNNMNNENVNEAVVEPVAEAVNEAVVEPVAEAVNEAVVEPVVEAVNEAVVEPVVEAVNEAVVEPVVEVVNETVAEPVNSVVDEAYNAAGSNGDYVSYDAQATKSAGNGLAIAALICGIVSIVCYCWGLGVLPGIAAIVCGIIGRKKCEKKAMATWGLVLGIIGVVIFLFAIIFSILAPLFGFTGLMGLSFFEALENSSYYY